MPPNTYSGRLDSDTTRRLLNMLRTWEREPRYRPLKARGPVARGGGPTLVKAKTGAGGIPAGSAGGATPGSATVTLYDSYVSGSLHLSASTVTALNFTTAAVGANKPVTLGYLPSLALWEVILEPC